MMIVTAGSAERKLIAAMKQKEVIPLSFLEVQASRATFYGEDPDLVLVTEQKVEQIICRDAVFLVRRHGGIPAIFQCEHAVAVVDSSNQALLEQVAHRHLPALTIGLASADTLTLSSLTADSAVVSLQRPVQTFDGTMLEPFELPVTFSSPIEPFSLLSCAAVFCLLGKKNPLAGRRLWQL